MNRAGTVALSPLSGLYGAMMKARRALYRNGLFRTHKVGAPVISVGNLTTGGTGKTPFVELIAREFARRQERVCILTRGYGRENPGKRVVVSNGSKILSDPLVAGDEPLLLAENLKGAASVVCDADRLSAAQWAIESLGSSLFILDDGFQHLRIARDFNLAVVDATNPWGNRRLLPAGMLRERPCELARADCVVITRAYDQVAADRLNSEVKKLSNGRPVFRSRMKISELRQLGSAERNVTLQEIKSLPLAAFCGVGNPESFFAQLHRAGFQLCHTKTFRDHHVYRQSEIDRMIDESHNRGAQGLITTAKDAVKLRTLTFTLPGYFVGIEIEIDEQAALIGLIENAIRR